MLPQNESFRYELDLVHLKPILMVAVLKIISVEKITDNDFNGKLLLVFSLEGFLRSL